MAKGDGYNHYRADKEEIQERMQVILQMRANNISEKNIRKFAIEHYNISKSQATRLLQKAMQSIKDLTSKNIEQLSLMIVAKHFHALQQAEDLGHGNNQHDARENIKLRLNILKEIREITDADRYINQIEDHKKGKIFTLSEL